MKWLKVGGLVLGGLILLLAVAPLFISLNDYVLLIEAQVSAKLKEPVKIAGLRAGGLPLPHVTVEGISIGKTDDIAIGRVTITPDLWSLLGSTKVIHTIRIDQLVLTQKAIDKIPVWTKGEPAKPGEPSQPPTVTVKSIRIDNAVVKLRKAAFGPFHGRLMLNDDNSLDAASIVTADGKLKALIKPERSQYRVDARARDWTLPIGPAIHFDELVVKVVVTLKGANFRNIRGSLYGGTIAGRTTLSWQKGTRLTGNASIYQVELRSLLQALGKPPSMSGKLYARPVFRANAAGAGQLLKVLHLETPFDVQNGVLRGVDISDAATSLFRDKSPSAETRFDQLSGHLVLDRGTRRFTQLNITAGSLSADGRVTISPEDELSGRIDTNIEASKVAAASLPLNVSGTVESPILLPTAGAAAGAAIGTAILGPAGTVIGTAIGSKIEQFFGGDTAQ
ncbi:MAG: AsmA family protein [Gammaproteobacteria bacterium]|nr:AsmA family protein [Gammaproteobacteria bacterium]MDH3412193.1 AsmA family protein [Gammaproteobacteria bacterium]